ncbi:hypothetical protein PBI_JOHANN_55 [Microbacterium phage Johann]|uniref:Uncharacterized protein n=2 Tax=Goodmanvirus goodman TaxID=2734238 RepID=A0A3G3LZQ8_9CAUD|nr:hypothetical protein HOU56_gp55 [Microbacterium phage Goodman]AYQ99510.1 hypothetical protein PBI_GOODMAN_55 [Microbacterium phage Goodman]AYQ99678.1 hypothetical protein PBI_JOHANN_55 [Microbacterium phage Johann]
MGTEIGQSTLDAWSDRIAQTLGVTVDGGPRVALREVLQEAFQRGLHYNDWSPVEDQEQAVKTRGSALYQWWMQTAHDEIVPMLAKAEEYGGQHRAADLTDIGRDLIAAGVAKGPLLGSGAVQDGWMQELGCYFYLRGKVGRWTAAIAEGRPVSDDTLHDIGIYVRMVQRIRAVGGWPV